MNAFNELISFINEAGLLGTGYIILLLSFLVVNWIEFITQLVFKRKLEAGDVGQMDFFEVEIPHRKMGQTENYLIGDRSEMGVYDSGGDDSFDFFLFDIPDSF